MPASALSLHRPLSGAKARIFGFTHAGGGASAFMKLRAALAPQGIDLCPLQPPGRENRIAEPPHATVEAMAEDFAAAIASLSPLPFALLGHSFGGLTAYLAARRLLAKGLVPQHLVVSGSIAPTLRGHETGLSTAANFRERIVALGGIPEVILNNPDLLEMFEKSIRADIALSDAYRHTDRDLLPMDITVYSGTRDRTAPPALATAWQNLTSRTLATRNFDGGHFFLYADPKCTAAALMDDLGW